MGYSSCIQMLMPIFPSVITRLSFRKIFELLFLSCSLSAPSLSFSLPFNPNPTDFTRYLESREWEDGKIRIFYDLRGCHSLEFMGSWFYSCDSGHVEITDSVRGTRYCELKKFTKSNLVVRYLANGELEVGDAFPCKSYK